MAIFYVDTEGGLDANNGTTFALRKKTVTSASTAAAANDTIRVMKSGDAVSIGTCTWTKNSSFITIPSGLISNIDMCETGWTNTDSVNNTLTYSTTAKEGTNAINIAIGAGFTTGRLIWKNLGTVLDLSPFAQLSFWIRQSAGTVAQAGDLTIRLCNDSGGNTPVHTFSVPALGLLNAWHAFTVDLGSVMQADISSIRIDVVVDRGAQTFQIDNIIAAKNASSGGLSLRSLISKNTGTEPWMPIRSINGTQLRADCAPATLSADAVALYAGTSGSVNTFRRETVRPAVPTSTSDFSYFTSIGKTLTVSGGWNTTDMSTQTGETYLDYTSGNGAFLFSPASGGTFTVSNINPVRLNNGFGLQAAGAYNITAREVIACTSSGFLPNGCINSTFNITNICYNSSSTSAPGAINLPGVSRLNNTFNITNINSNFGPAIGAGALDIVNAGNGYSYRETFNIGASINNAATVTGAAAQIHIASFMDSVFNIGTVASSASGLSIGSAGPITTSINGSPPMNNVINISGPLSTTTATAQALRILAGTGNTVNLGANTVTGTGTAVLISHSGANNVINGGSISGTAPYDGASVRFNETTFSAAPTAADVNAYSSKIIAQSYNGTVGDNRIYSPLGIIQSDTSIRHTGSGYSWKISPTSANASAAYPLELPIAQAAVGAGTLVTASIWVYRTNTGITSNWLVKGGTGEILPATITASAAGSAGAWEQITITFTPSTAGVVQFAAQAYGGTTFSAYFDDMTISQAD